MNAHKIRRSQCVDGSNRVDITSFGLTSVPNDIVVDRTHSQLYWTLDGFNSGSIQRSDLSGSGIQTLVATGSDELAELELDLPDGKMFWTEFTSGLICESNLDGSGLQTLVSGSERPAQARLSTYPTERCIGQNWVVVRVLASSGPTSTDRTNSCYFKVTR